MATLGTTKKPSERKPLHKVSDLFDVKEETDVHQLGAAKTKHKENSKGIHLWSNIKNRKGYTKINISVKQDLYGFILQHPQVLQSTQENNCVKLSVDFHT